VCRKPYLPDRNTNQSRCVGFVRFESTEEAETAVNTMNGRVLPGSSKPLTVRIAQKREKRMPPVTILRPPNGRFDIPLVYGDSPFAAYGYTVQGTCAATA